jgi:hypothetical protein
MKATGGLTHFIDGDAVEKASQARCANLSPAGPRGAERLEGGADLGPRQTCVVPHQRQPFARPAERLDQRPRQAEGKVEGREPRSREHSQAEKEGKSAWATISSSTTVESPRRNSPSATVIGFRREGALVKSTPASRIAVSRAPARRPRRRCRPRPPAQRPVAFAEEAPADQRGEQHRDLARRRDVADRRQPYRVQHQHVAERPEYGDHQRCPPLGAPDLAKAKPIAQRRRQEERQAKTLPT